MELVKESACRALLLLFAALSLSLFAMPAHANDVDVASRSVVRVLIIGEAGSNIFIAGHGSGFAVAPNKIVTNAHVIKDVARFPRRYAAVIIPSEGSRPYVARITRANPAKDLALLTAVDANFPPLAIYSGPLKRGMDVASLGYPGNVDKATFSRRSDYIKPRKPVLSEGNFSNIESVSNIEALIHNANISQGNSGGPLVDECGRVLGVNTFQTINNNGDSQFAFAVSTNELMRFLRSADQSFVSIADRCVTAEEFAAQEAARIAAEEEQERQELEAQAQAEREHTQRLERDAERKITDERETMLFASIGLLFFGTLAIGGGAMAMLQGEKRKSLGIALITAGALAFIAAVTLFALRPSMSQDEIEKRIYDSVQSDTGEDDSPEQSDALETSSTPDNGQNVVTAATVGASSQGEYLCIIDRSKGRITTSSGDDVELGWQNGGCVNGSKQYAPDNNDQTWSRILVPNDTATITRLRFDPETKTLTMDKYALPLDIMEQARNLRARIRTDACTANNESVETLAQRQDDILAILPSAPNERLVYNCR